MGFLNKTLGDFMFFPIWSHFWRISITSEVLPVPQAATDQEALGEKMRQQAWENVASSVIKHGRGNGKFSKGVLVGKSSNLEDFLPRVITRGWHVAVEHVFVAELCRRRKLRRNLKNLNRRSWTCRVACDPSMKVTHVSHGWNMTPSLQTELRKVHSWGWQGSLRGTPVNLAICMFVHRDNASSWMAIELKTSIGFNQHVLLEFWSHLAVRIWCNWVAARSRSWETLLSRFLDNLLYLHISFLIYGFA